MPRSAGDTLRKSASFRGERLHSALKSGILRPLHKAKLKSRFQLLERENPNDPKAETGLLSTESYAERWITGQLASEDRHVQKNSTLVRSQWSAPQPPRCMAGAVQQFRRERPLKSSCAQPMMGMCMVRRAGHRTRFLLKKQAVDGKRPSICPCQGCCWRWSSAMAPRLASLPQQGCAKRVG